MKRTFDFLMALLAIIILLPVFFLIAVLVVLDSKGPIIYRQKRVGFNKIDFNLYKFRTMVVNQSGSSQITIGSRDPRITRVGYWLRKYKLDELPQLFNIVKGDMSFVGPRPEVRKYVDLYSREQERVFSVRPGLTDWASIKFSNESDLLASARDPEAFYIQQVVPEKLSMNLKYIEKQSFWVDCTIILLTLKKIVISRQVS